VDFFLLKMKISIVVCLVLALLCTFTKGQCPSTIDPTKFSVTFSDDFNTFDWYNATSNTGTWMTEYPYGGISGRTLSGNGELEYYSDITTGFGNPFSVSNSILSIETQPVSGLPVNSNGVQLLYTSGVITTFKSFSQTYGYFEIRAQLPWGPGFWPAFWLLNVDETWPPEIDVLEAFGAPDQWGQGTNTEYHYAVHSQVSGDSWGNWFNTNSINITDSFNIYGALWTAGNTCFYLNNQLVIANTTAGDNNSPMFILANLAVGGYWPGNPTSATPFPSYMQIDYINVYSVGNFIL